MAKYPSGVPSYLTNPDAGKKPFKVHDSITLKRVEEAVERYNHSTDNPGFCLDCGEEQMVASLMHVNTSASIVELIECTELWKFTLV